MSGGAFDYKDCALNDLSDMIAREIGFLEYGSDRGNTEEKTLTYMKALCKELNKLSKVVHSLDYFLSGDTSEDKFIADYEELYNKEK